MTMERIADGFALAEGPAITADGTLLVSDVMAGGVRRFDVAGNELAPLIEGRRGIGGVVVRPDASVVVSGRDLCVISPDGDVSVLAEPDPAGTGYNDLTLTPAGDLLAGMLTCRPMTSQELTPGVLVHVKDSGEHEVLALGFSWPNGIGFSPSGHRVYVADFDEGILYAGDWNGSVSDLDLRPWFVSPSGDADGLAVDSRGHVWLASGSGGSVLRIDPDGDLVATLDVPDDFVSSCCFWPNARRLVVTTGTGVFVHDLES